MGALGDYTGILERDEEGETWQVGLQRNTLHPRDPGGGREANP